MDPYGINRKSLYLKSILQITCEKFSYCKSICKFNGKRFRHMFLEILHQNQNFYFFVFFDAKTEIAEIGYFYPFVNII